MNVLYTIVNVLLQNVLRWKQTFSWFQKVKVLLAEVRVKQHESSNYVSLENVLMAVEGGTKSLTSRQSTSTPIL